MTATKIPKYSTYYDVKSRHLTTHFLNFAQEKGLKRFLLNQNSCHLVFWWSDDEPVWTSTRSTTSQQRAAQRSKTERLFRWGVYAYIPHPWFCSCKTVAHTHCGLYFHSFTISGTQQTNEPFVVVVRRSPSGSLVHIYGTCDLVVRVRASTQLVMSVQSYDQGFKGQVHLNI